MNERSERRAPITIVVRGDDGEEQHYDLVSDEALVDFVGLLDRYLERCEQRFARTGRAEMELKAA